VKLYICGPTYHTVAYRTVRVGMVSRVSRVRVRVKDIAKVSVSVVM